MIPNSRGEIPASWVVREKDGGRVLFETFNRKMIQAINAVKYEAVPICEYLSSLNGKRNAQSPKG